VEISPDPSFPKRGKYLQRGKYLPLEKGGQEGFIDFSMASPRSCCDRSC
jgi:hypothetical protein